VNWGSSSAWIGVYFLDRIEKTTIHHKLLRSVKCVGFFNVLKKVSTNIHSNFLLLRSEESRHHLRTHIFMLKLLCKICRTVSLSMLINSASARMPRRRFCRNILPTFSMLASVFDVLGRPGRGNTHTHTRQDFSEGEVSSSQRPLSAQHTTNTADEQPYPQRDPSNQGSASLTTYIREGHVKT